MGIRVPRITLNADYREKSSFGELGLISIGYGLHQAWVYSTMFATPSTFGTAVFITGFHGVYASLTFIVSIFVYAFCLLFASATDQRLLRFYVSKRTLAVAAVAMSISSFALVTPMPPDSTAAFAIEIASGIFTGIGSAELILQWGIAFARCDPSSIMLNGTFAIVVGFGVYALGTKHLAYPALGVLAAAIPLVELAILWTKVPRPFYERGVPPAFSPLAVNKAKFAAKFGVPVFVFGLSLGTLRQTSVQSILSATSLADQVVTLAASLCAAALILITVLALGGSGRWNRLFRPIIPFIAVVIVFIPSAVGGFSPISSAVLLVGYICFEALMWIFFGELSQRFTISPIFVFGLGRGLLALATFAGSILPVFISIDALPFGEGTLTLALLLIMVVAYALLPDEREVQDVVAPCPAIRAVLEAIDADAARPQGALTVVDAEAEAAPAKALPADLAAAVAASAVSATALAARAADGTAKADCSEGSEAGGRTEGRPADAGGADGAGGTGRGALASATRGGRAGADEAREAGADGLRSDLGDEFRRKCETVARRYLLSNRESEVMACLARGLNSSSIQERLYISEGTAKTHIRHVYRKLDVHAQQELILLVENAPTE